MKSIYKNTQNIIENISVDRLSSYKFDENDSTDLILSRYVYNVQISESFYPVLSALEISLRNRLYNAIAKLKGDNFRNRIFHHEIIINNKNGIENCYEITKKVLYSLSEDYAQMFEDILRFDSLVKQKP